MDKMYKDFIVPEENECKRKEEILRKAEESLKRAFANPQASVWYCKDYMAKRNGMYTNDELIEKAFVNDWMSSIPIMNGYSIVNRLLQGLMVLYEGYNTLMYDDETEVVWSRC